MVEGGLTGLIVECKREIWGFSDDSPKFCRSLANTEAIG